MTNWRLYERFVASFISSDFASDDVTVIPNAKIIGISGIKRQIDVLIDAKWDIGFNRRIIVDAKSYKEKIDIKDIESFEGMMRDCRAQYGILICPNGYTTGAKRRAQDLITIKLVPLSELENFSIDNWDLCMGRCVSLGRQSQHGLVLYDSYGLAITDSPLSISAVGKCDVCNEFHVWCWDCGEKFPLKNEDEYQCGCEDRFWLTSIEDDDVLTKSVYLYLVLLSGVVISVDRRRLS